ncbi:MAGUK family member discs large 5 isoform X1 [Rhodnius prolixus]|uniref:MAGUK family member discs large 5 isoform X1 n=1 Tax=Rhodnius prolixus TaxID=13249 RepID=UPI003D18E179
MMSSGNSSLDGVSNSDTLTRSYSTNSERSSTSGGRESLPSRDYDGLKSQCEKAMHELQVLRRQHSETVRRCEHTMKELDYYRGQHHAAMAQLVESAAQESSSLRTKYELVSDLRTSQEGDNGNIEAVNQLYLTTLSKYEAMKSDYDNLTKRYDTLATSHTVTVDKLELAQEEMARVKKQCEEMMNERNLAIRERNGLKQQCTAAIRQWDIALRERNEYQEALVKVQQQHEEAVKEINQAMAVRMKASKDIKRLTEERNAAMQEYSLIMSERDTVHKEMEKLTEDLTGAFKKNSILEAELKELQDEKKALAYQVETLKREIASALHDRDKALKECNDLREKFGELSTSSSLKEDDHHRRDKTRLLVQGYSRERESGSKDECESQSGSMELYVKCQKERIENLDQADQEIERIGRQNDKLQAELQEALQEAEVCKRRRDWAFSERDKIVLERESIRTLCDRLRRERDRAVSELAETLRDSDEVKRQRDTITRQLNTLKEKMEAQIEKENRMVQLHSVGHNYSHDSAIDTDMQEFDSEMLSIDLNGMNSTEDLGVELCGGRDDPQYPNDTGIYVSSVAKGSIADGKLKPYDCVVRVNNVDCTNVSKRLVLETMRCVGNAAIMVVRRRRLYTAQLKLSKYDHGITLESGIYISKISPGSLAAKEGNLSVGDRIVSINNKTVEGVMSSREAMSLLNEARDVLLITTLKSYNNMASSSLVSGSSAGSSSTESRQMNCSTQTSVDQLTHSPRTNLPTGNSPSPVSTKWVNLAEEKKKNRNSSPVVISPTPAESPTSSFDRERESALGVLDSVIASYSKGGGTIRESSRHKYSNGSDGVQGKLASMDGGTWPKARGCPAIEAGTATILPPRRKTRLPLSLLLNNSPNYLSFPACCEQSRADMKELDLNVRTGNAGKEELEYYVKKKGTRNELLSGTAGPGPDDTSPLVGSVVTNAVHSRIHSQLYPGAPHYPLPFLQHPHSHRHGTGTPSNNTSTALATTTFSFHPSYNTIQYGGHRHSPSADCHYNKMRSVESSVSATDHDLDHSHHHHFTAPGTFPRKREDRFRIPSNPSVASKSSGAKVSSSSIEKTSDRGSPMPTFHVEVLSPGHRQNKTTSLPDYCWPHKPSPGELRRVHIDKSSEPLGIQISCLDSGGVFVSTVSENSLASQVGLRVGDQLLEVCGINMRCATYRLAASVLRQCRDSITMLVQYSPQKYHELEGTGSSSGDSKTRSGSPTPCNSPRSNRKSLPTHLTQAITSMAVSNASSPRASPVCCSDEPRYLLIETQKCSNLGISLVGGNAVGIYVHSVQTGSLAYEAGLRMGDRILEYNGTDLRQATAEEAAYELAKPADKVTVLAQYCIERYNEVKDKPGDSFYIRAMFDRLGDVGEVLQLRFKKDDILHVDNTMFNGVPGSWRAWLLDEDGFRQQCGIIPSKYKVEEEMVVRRSLGDLEGEARRGTRRSFFRRKKHQRSDSKELASFSNIGVGWYSDSGMLNEDACPLASYQRVIRLNYPQLRAVLVVGPLSDWVTDKLIQDFPDRFCRCVPEVMHCSQTIMDKGVADNVFVDYRKKGSFFECTSVSAVKDMCDKNVHCILDVALSSVERLHRHQIYPIVLLIKFKSTKQIREVKDTRFPLDKVTAKAAKEMYEHSLKLESEYRHHISAVIPATGVNIAYMCTQIKAAVEIEQNKTLWVPYCNQ